MSTIKVEFDPDFKGEPVVLLAMDREGLEAFRSVLAESARNPQRPSPLNVAGITHTFVFLTDNKARVEIEGNQVRWLISSEKATEILNKLEALRVAGPPGHHYVDIAAPASTLVLSRGEYV